MNRSKLKTLIKLLRSPELLRRHSKFYRHRNSPLWFWVYPSVRQYYYNTFFRNRNFNRNYRKSLRNDNNRFIAFAPAFQNEGIGGQIIKWNTALILSQKFNLKFVHHPFTKSDHSMEADWDMFFGFGEDKVIYDEIISEKNIKVVWLPPLKIQSNGPECFQRKMPADFLAETFKYKGRSKKVIFHLGAPTWAYDQLSTSKILRRKYWKARLLNPIDAPFHNDKINIALHMRRGDVKKLKDNNMQLWRWFDDSYYLAICKELNRILGNKQVAFHVFSDGKPEEFEDYKFMPNISFHLKQNTAEDAFHAFHSMVIADILVLGSSSFSYIAGIISKNIKIARYPWVHHIPNGQGWVRSASDGNFEPKEMISNLTKEKKNMRLNY